MSAKFRNFPSNLKLSVKKVVKKAVMYNYYYDFFSWAQFSLNCSRTIVRQILKLSVKFKNCPANLENCPPNFQNCPPNFKIVRQILKFYFFFQNCPPKKNCPRIPRTTDNFENCPRTIVVRQFPKTQFPKTQFSSQNKSKFT